MCWLQTPAAAGAREPAISPLTCLSCLPQSLSDASDDTGADASDMAVQAGEDWPRASFDWDSAQVRPWHTTSRAPTMLHHAAAVTHTLLVCSCHPGDRWSLDLWKSVSCSCHIHCHVRLE